MRARLRCPQNFKTMHQWGTNDLKYRIANMFRLVLNKLKTFNTNFCTIFLIFVLHNAFAAAIDLILMLTKPNYAQYRSKFIKCCVLL